MNIKTPPLVPAALIAGSPWRTQFNLVFHWAAFHPRAPGDFPNAMNWAVSWDGKMPFLTLMVSSSYKALQCLLEQRLEHKGFSSEPSALNR